MPVALRCCIGSPGGAGDAARQNWAVESRISKFVSRRELPPLGLRVKRKRRLEDVAALREQGAEAVLAGSDDPAHFASVAENFVPVGTGLRFRLVEPAIVGSDLPLQIVGFVLPSPHRGACAHP